MHYFIFGLGLSLAAVAVEGPDYDDKAEEPISNQNHVATPVTPLPMEKLRGNPLLSNTCCNYHFCIIIPCTVIWSTLKSFTHEKFPKKCDWWGGTVKDFYHILCATSKESVRMYM